MDLEIKEYKMMNARQMCDVMNKRDKVINEYCKKHKVKKEDLTFDQILEIREIPEWKNASKLPEGY